MPPYVFSDQQFTSLGADNGLLLGAGIDDAFSWHWYLKCSTTPYNKFGFV